MGQKIWKKYKLQEITIDGNYGNMGNGKFKGGTKNQKGFVPNMTIF